MERHDVSAGISRRTLLRWSGSAGMMAVAATITQACTVPGTEDPAADDNGVILPEGFSSRIIARAGEAVLDTPFTFRAFPDGAATEGPVQWRTVPQPDPSLLDTPCRHQVPDTLAFSGGEGISTLGDLVWFSTKGDDRIWQYELSTGEITLRYQAGSPSALSGVDNLWIDAASGALLVAEDGGDMEVIRLSTDNIAVPVVRLPDQDHSEITGPCFSPDGQRLYFSSQRAQIGDLGLPLGVTYEVTGPFDELLGRV